MDEYSFLKKIKLFPALLADTIRAECLNEIVISLWRPRICGKWALRYGQLEFATVASRI